MFSHTLTTTNRSFEKDFHKYLLNRGLISNDVQDLVAEIILDVKSKGDEALLRYTNSLDNRNLSNIHDIFLDDSFLQKSLNRITMNQREALELSFNKIKDFHNTTKLNYPSFDKKTKLSRIFRPLEKVGAYVPGGKANYPSTVLMVTIPAIVAGVKEILITLPAPNGDLSDFTLAAAKLVGVDKVYTVGGAQAIAALALGTETITKVDKIIGPGNKYVTEAKRQLYGKVGIDGIQGPSEILVIADNKSNIDYVVWDLISQAEHDEMASSILISDSLSLINEVKKKITSSVINLDRAQIILESFKKNSVAIKVQNIDEAIEISNFIAPEHLFLAIEKADTYLNKVKNAGIILAGEKASIALSDYVLGPSHVLPTTGSARFASSLCVEDFMNFSNLVNFETIENISEYEDLLDKAIILAESEGLTAHSISAKVRKKLL